MTAKLQLPLKTRNHLQPESLPSLSLHFDEILQQIKLRRRQLIFCCTGSRENYFGSVGRQNINNNNPKFQGGHI